MLTLQSQESRSNQNHPTPTTDPIWTTKISAEYLGMKPGTLEVWRVQGKGPRFIKFMKNGAVRYRKSDLDAWIAEHTRASTSQE